MDTFTVVRPEHLNQNGFLFGGQMLLWVDENAWLAAMREFPRCKFVTIAFETAVFKKAVPLGAIMRFSTTLRKKGNTSASFDVEVYAAPPGETKEDLVFTTTISFVSVDENGRKKPIVE